MTARACVHLCLSVYLHQHINMCVDPAMHMHTYTLECVFTCLAEHLVCVISKLGTDRTDVGELDRDSFFLCGPVACGGVFVHPITCPAVEASSDLPVSSNLHEVSYVTLLSTHHAALPWSREVTYLCSRDTVPGSNPSSVSYIQTSWKPFLHLTFPLLEWK